MNNRMQPAMRRWVATILVLTIAPAAAQSRYAPALHLPAVDDVAYRSIEELRQTYGRGLLTPVDITRLFLQRIEAIDRAGPTLNAVIETNPDAIDIARVAAMRYRRGPISPLTGIPILLKDNIDTGDRMRTSAGSLAFSDPAPRDAGIVAKLREAGAVILGKANLSEWSNFRSYRSVNGWSARGGFTRHPYILEVNPLGSSSGSGAAVAAGLATVAIGTETSGSIVAPARVMGLVGIKPTVGLVSRTGIIPISQVQDTAGPMARSVADAAAVLTAIAGTDPSDPATVMADRYKTDYTRFRNVRGMRIGIVRGKTAGRGQPDPAVARAAELLEKSGAVIVDSLAPPAVDQAMANHLPLLLAEFRHAIDIYLSRRQDPSFQTLDDLIAFNDREAGKELVEFDQSIFLSARDALRVDSRQYELMRADASRAAGPEGIDAILHEHQLDALLASPPMVGVAALAGYPVVTLPTHFDGELPAGAQIFGAKWSEPTLISIAAAIEAEAQAFRRPKFLPMLPIR